MDISFTLNGNAVSVTAEPDSPLLWVLRDELRLTGTKFGCGIAQCGACTVFVDGSTRRSCVTPISAIAGSRVTTIEGLDSPEADAVQAAWEKIDVPQCGYCQSGQVMSAVALLKAKPTPSNEDIDNGMAGNICRCASYVRIRQAIHDAADLAKNQREIAGRQPEVDTSHIVTNSATIDTTSEATSSARNVGLSNQGDSATGVSA